MLLELPPFPQVPGTHRVVQTPCPQLRTIVRDIYAAGTICVALELPLNSKKIMQIFQEEHWQKARGLLEGSWCSGSISKASLHQGIPPRSILCRRTPVQPSLLG